MTLALSAAATLAFAASSTDTTFQAFYQTIQGWLGGSLGKTFAVITLGVGLEIGVTKQSPAAVLIALSMAVALVFGPGVFEGVFNATL